MAITFIQEKKKQRYLILILALIISAILLIVWWGFFRAKEVPTSSLVAPAHIPPKIKIDWQTLDNFRSQNFQSFEKISEFKEEFGRENPFTPY